MYYISVYVILYVIIRWIFNIITIIYIDIVNYNSIIVWLFVIGILLDLYIILYL